jgi:hypothetical protein
MNMESILKTFLLKARTVEPEKQARVTFVANSFCGDACTVCGYTVRLPRPTLRLCHPLTPSP